MPPLTVVDANALMRLPPLELDLSTSKPTASKRSAPDADEVDPDSILLPGESSGYLRIDLNCDQVRRRIRAFLESGEMKVGEFCSKLGVSGNSYRRFMSVNGPDKGSGSDAYMEAWAFFEKREQAGLKMPRKKAKKEAGSKFDVNGITLGGEETESVEIYDTCDELRRKINAHLRNPDVTQAALLKEFRAMYPGPRQIQSKQLHDFLSKKGAMAGNSSCIYYAAYVYFEKLRIKEGKEKTVMREEMEDIHHYGVSRELQHGYVSGRGYVPVEDKYGRVTIQRYF